jgi:hypothetical protein
MGLEREERSTNVEPIEKACEVSLEENILIFDYMEEVVHQEMKEVKNIYMKD